MKISINLSAAKETPVSESKVEVKTQPKQSASTKRKQRKANKTEV